MPDTAKRSRETPVASPACTATPSCSQISPKGSRTAPSGCHARSEEHTSELQSLMRISYAVFCLKKKKQKDNISLSTTISYKRKIINNSKKKHETTQLKVIYSA